MKKLYLIYILILIFILSFSLSILFVNEKNKNEKSYIIYENKINKLQQENDILLNNCIYSYSNENYLIPDSIQVKSENGEIIKLTSILNSRKIIMFFPSISCGACYSTEFELLKGLKKDIGMDNLLIITNYRELRDCIIFKTSNGISFPVFNLLNPKIGLEVEKLEKPFVFVSDNSLRTKLVFVPDKNMPKLSQLYYNSIKKMFGK